MIQNGSSPQVSGQIIIFHQPGFPWNKTENPRTKPPMWQGKIGRSSEVHLSDLSFGGLMVSRHSSNSACGRGKFFPPKEEWSKKRGPLDLEIFLEINPHYFQAKNLFNTSIQIQTTSRNWKLKLLASLFWNAGKHKTSRTKTGGYLLDVHINPM